MGIVITDKNGRVVRSLAIESEEFFVIQRASTGRIEAVNEVESLRSQKEKFRLIAQTSKRELKNRSVSLGKNGQLTHIDRVIQFAPNLQLKDEHRNAFKPILRWTALSHMLVLLVFLVTHLIVQSFFTEEPRIVTVIKQPAVKKRVSVVKSSPKKIKKRRITKRKVVKKKKVVKNRSYRRRVSQKKVTSKKRYRTPVRRTVKVENLGALGALNGIAGSPSKKGVNLGKVNGRAGSVGAKGGGRGHKRALYGKSMMAASPGRGTKVAGAGRYKSRGQGGGRQGYGKKNYSGSTNASLFPLEEEALIEGGLERDQIAAVIRRNMGQVIYCYEQGLQTNPRLAGRVAVKFVISPSGKVSTAKVARRSLPSSKVAGCIVRRLRGWKFPKPYGAVSVNVTYPFLLQRVSGSQSVSQR